MPGWMVSCIVRAAQSVRIGFACMCIRREVSFMVMNRKARIMDGERPVATE